MHLAYSILDIVLFLKSMKSKYTFLQKCRLTEFLAAKDSWHDITWIKTCHVYKNVNTDWTK